MGLTWYDQPTRCVVDLTRGDRIIDIRTAGERRRRTHPDPAEVAAIRWTVFGVRCSLELSWGTEDRARDDRRPVRSGA